MKPGRRARMCCSAACITSVMTWPDFAHAACARTSCRGRRYAQPGELRRAPPRGLCASRAGLDARGERRRRRRGVQRLPRLQPRHPHAPLTSQVATAAAASSWNRAMPVIVACVLVAARGVESMGPTSSRSGKARYETRGKDGELLGDAPFPQDVQQACVAHGREGPA